MNKIYGLNKHFEKLSKVLKYNTTPILIFGEAHNGKSYLAQFIAKKLFCEDQGEYPCNICRSCQRFNNGNEVDYLFIEDEENKGRLTLDSVDKIKDFCLSKPLQNQNKVVVVKDIHKFNHVSQNALLKTLEEPPQFVRFIFTSSKSEFLLDTINSRTISIPIYNISKDSILEFIEDTYPDIDQIRKDIVLNYSQSIYVANLFLHDSLFEELRIAFFEYIEDIPSGKIFHLMSKNPFSKYIENFSIISMILNTLLMDIIYYNINQHKYITNSDKLDLISNLSTHTNKLEIMNMINTLNQFSIYFEGNIKRDLIISNLVINLIKCFRIK